MTDPTESLKRLRALEHGQVARYRTGIAGRTEPEWGNWKSGPLFVQKREGELPKRYGRNGTRWQDGALLILCPHEDVTAEYSEEDYSPEYDCFNNEEYYLQIDWDSLI